METRVFERVCSNIKAEVYYNDGIYEATVRTLSRNGLYIDTDICLPYESNIEIVLILDDTFLKLSGKVKRSVKTKELNGIGVQLFNPSQSYFAFVKSSLNQKQFQLN